MFYSTYSLSLKNCYFRGLDDVKLALQIVGALLRSGRVKLIEISHKLLESMKKGKTLDWKVHVDYCIFSQGFVV